MRKKDNRLKVCSSKSQIGNHEEYIDAKIKTVKGADLKVSVNVKFILEALSVIETPQIEFSVRESLKPCTIRGRTTSKLEDSYMHVIMPLKA